jgi:hypothetical protein
VTTLKGEEFAISILTMGSTLGEPADQKFPSQNSVELDSEVLTRIFGTVQETCQLSSLELPIAIARRRPIM